MRDRSKERDKEKERGERIRLSMEYWKGAASRLEEAYVQEKEKSDRVIKELRG